jgi:hypothetical protein
MDATLCSCAAPLPCCEIRRFDLSEFIIKFEPWGASMPCIGAFALLLCCYCVIIREDIVNDCNNLSICAMQTRCAAFEDNGIQRLQGLHFYTRT